MNTALVDLLHRQSGVLSRRQAHENGLDDHDIKRLLRRREWAVVHRGVYVNHTGPLTTRQHAWAAVVALWPAALSHESAIRDPVPGRIQVAVDNSRCVRAPMGVKVHRLSEFDAKVHLNASPPRVRIEQAVLDVAAEAVDDFAAVAALAGVVQERRTTVPRILSAMEGRSRLARRTFIESVLTDIAEGSCSALEQAYIERVERPHGLPKPRRQHRPIGLQVVRDMDYEQFGLVIELDGRQFHDNALARDCDLERDIDALLHEGRDTVRLGWGQVVRRSCSTSVKVGTLCSQRGWTGRWHPCPVCPQSR